MNISGMKKFEHFRSLASKKLFLGKDICNGSDIVKITQEDSNGQEILSHHPSCS
jgi:hypothetical protein